MTSVEIPYSIAAALPSLTVLDITNEVAHAVAEDGGSGIAYVSPNGGPSLVRVAERESGFFADFEGLLERLVPHDQETRIRLVTFLLGPRTEQVPYVRGRLSLGRWQRILLVDLHEGRAFDWTLTLVG